MHHFLGTMRLTDYIASLLDIENYQKFLINKARDYQIKQLNFNTKKKSESREVENLSTSLVSEQP